MNDAGQKKLLETLAAEFPLIVRTPYHVQIETTDGMHNIWFAKGSVKFQPYGHQDWHWVTRTELLTELRAYDYGKSDLAFMLSLAKFMGEIQGKSGIFVDAGWKDGKAKVAIVKSQTTGDMDITVRLIESPSSYHAEYWAIEKAMEIYPGDEPVFSDCQMAVQNLVERNYSNRPRWICREKNREADALGNMRQKI